MSVGARVQCEWKSKVSEQNPLRLNVIVQRQSRIREEKFEEEKKIRHTVNSHALDYSRLICASGHVRVSASVSASVSAQVLWRRQVQLCPCAPVW